MEEVIRSWWQFIKAHRITFQFVAIFLVIAIILILIGYQLDWTGFKAYDVTVKPNAPKRTILPTNITVTLPSKTLYDWLQLLIIPFVIAVAGYFINLTISRGEQAEREQRDKTERNIAFDRQRETILKDYIDKMSELLLHENLSTSSEGDEVRKVADFWTAYAFSRLATRQKVNVVDFLRISKLIEADKIVDLSNCDLSKADYHNRYFKGLNFTGAYMREFDFSDSDMSNANLCRAYLADADLTNADLTNADLTNAYLTNAYLTNAKVTPEQLAKTKSLRGAIMPDGSTHP